MEYNEEKNPKTTLTESGRLKLENINLAKIDDFFRKISFNKPWVKALMFGIPAYYGGKALAPLVATLLSPHLGKLDKRLGSEFADMRPEDQQFLRRVTGSMAAILAAAPTVVSNIDFTGSKPWLGLNNFAPKTVEKEASMLPPMQPFNSIPAYKAQNMLTQHPGLTPLTRMATSSLVGTFPGNQQLTGGSIINRAIKTGYDAMAGGALGFLTAHALGLPNPLVTAGIAAGINAFR